MAMPEDNFFKFSCYICLHGDFLISTLVCQAQGTISQLCKVPKKVEKSCNALNKFKAYSTLPFSMMCKKNTREMDSLEQIITVTLITL